MEVRGKEAPAVTIGDVVYVKDQRWRAHLVPEHGPIRKRSDDRVNFTRMEHRLWLGRGRTKFAGFGLSPVVARFPGESVNFLCCSGEFCGL